MKKGCPRQFMVSVAVTREAFAIHHEPRYRRPATMLQAGR